MSKPGIGWSQTAIRLSPRSPSLRYPLEKHPLRDIRAMVDEALREMSARFDEIYPEEGRRSIPPERLLRALLLQMLYSIRSERMLMEQLEYNPAVPLVRWTFGQAPSRTCRLRLATLRIRNQDRANVDRLVSVVLRFSKTGGVAMTLQPANTFHLTGSGITINYSGDLVGGTTVSFEEGGRKQTFQAKDIKRESTIPGELISITIAKTVDIGFTSFSFLLPLVHVSSGGGRQSFETVGIKAVHKTSLVQPATGVRTTYEAHTLKGSAELREALKAQG
jgi:hypothetical protein